MHVSCLWFVLWRSRVTQAMDVLSSFTGAWWEDLQGGTSVSVSEPGIWIQARSLSLFLPYSLPLVVKTSTSHTDKEPSTPTSCRNTCWPVRVRAHVNVLVTPSSVTRIVIGILNLVKYEGITWVLGFAMMCVEAIRKFWRGWQMLPSQWMRKAEVDLHKPKVWNIKVVSFIAVPGTVTLAQRKSASAGTSSDSCSAQYSVKKNFTSSAKPL